MTDAGKAIRALAEERGGRDADGHRRRAHPARGLRHRLGVRGGGGRAGHAVLLRGPRRGRGFNIMAFVVVVLGGMGNFLGALLGGFIVGLAESLGAAFLPGSLKQLVVFGLFVLVLLLRPEGLFGGAPWPLGSPVALALALLVAVPPLLPKYVLEVLISVLFFGYLGACLEHPGRLRRAVLVRPRRLLRHRGLHLDPALPPARRHALARHGRGRRAGRRVRPLRGLPLVPLRAPRPVLLPGDAGLRRDAAGRRGELEGGGLLARPRRAEPGRARRCSSSSRASCPTTT